MNSKAKYIRNDMDAIAILHNIRGMHNVGSIMRTSDGAGIKKIYLCGITPTPVDRFGKPRQKFVKVSLGAEKSVQWEKIHKTAPLIKKLKKEGYKIFAAEKGRRSLPISKAREIPGRKDKIAFLVGNEIKGVPPKILRLADRVLEIPMLGKQKSLNVSVAFGVVIYSTLFGAKK